MNAGYSQVKKIGTFHKPTGQNFYNIIYNFMHAPTLVTDNTLYRLIANLHHADIFTMYDKSLYFKTIDETDTLGRFSFYNQNGKEYQAISFNPLQEITDPLYKKAVTLTTYFHETTHEKQRDYFIYNNRNNLAEATDYNKYLNLEMVYNEEYVLYDYSLRLIEIDALYNSCIRYQQLFTEKSIPTTKQTISAGLHACLKFLNSFSLDGKGLNLSSKQLVEYYKDYFNNSQLIEDNNVLNCADVINNSQLLCNAKKKEVQNINFDNIEKELNQKIFDIYEIMKSYANALLKVYTPSAKVCSKFKIYNQDRWIDFANANIFDAAVAMSNEYVEQYSKGMQSPLFEDEKE